MKNLFSFELKVCYMRPVILALLSFGRQNGLQYNGTLQALFLQFAAVFIRNGNIAVNKVGIGMAAAAAEEPCPALAQAGFVITWVWRNFCTKSGFTRRYQACRVYTAHALQTGGRGKYRLPE